MQDPKRYIRKPFEVFAVQVSHSNMDEVAEWCSGVIESQDSEGRHRFIRVPVKNSLNDRQTKAFVGDWVLRAKDSFKSYTSRAFEKSFDPVMEVSLHENQGELFVYRDAGTGEFVTASHAEDNPQTTIKQNVRTGERTIEVLPGVDIQQGG